MKCVDCDIGYFLEIVDSTAQCSMKLCNCRNGNETRGSSCIEMNYDICEEESCYEGFYIRVVFDIFKGYNRKLCEKEMKTLKITLAIDVENYGFTADDKYSDYTVFKTDVKAYKKVPSTRNLRHFI